jgi:protein-tyrosine phosphatase
VPSERFFVDVHSHVCPSGDDGVQTLEEGERLCRSAAERGTRLLFATPHVWPHLVLGDERERAIRAAFAPLQAGAPLELRLGFELTPAPALLREDLWRYELQGTGAVLVEVPLLGPAEPFFAVAEHARSLGLRLVAAHPERTEAVFAEPSLVREIVQRGCLIQVNGSSLLGADGPEVEALGWSVLEDESASLVASDWHRRTRPAHLDKAYACARERLGARARRLFDGSALGLAEAAAA